MNQCYSKKYVNDNLTTYFNGGTNKKPSKILANTKLNTTLNTPTWDKNTTSSLRSEKSSNWRIKTNDNVNMSANIDKNISENVNKHVNKHVNYLVNTPEFSVSVSNVNGANVYNITWKSNPIPAHIYKSVVSNFRRNDNYAPMSDHQRTQIAEQVADINKYNSTHVTTEQLISIRNIVIKEKIIKNYPRMNRDINVMLAEYNKGKCILELAQKYDFAPLNLLRGLLLASGRYSQRVIYSVFALKTPPDTYLRGYDMDQYNLAVTNDAESTFNQQENERIALENEARVVEYFKSLGIRIKNQDLLVAEQVAEFGRAIHTPDILFLDTVFINGRRCHWIDYKDYICTRVNFLYTSNCAQAEKYNAVYGEGALAFHHSYVNGVKINHAQLLDVRVLPVKLI